MSTTLLVYIGIIIFVIIAILSTAVGRRLKLVTTLDPQQKTGGSGNE